MSDIATPGANALLDGTALGATLYVQLHTGDPGTNGTANVATESARKAFTRTAAAGGVATNVASIEWPSAAATETATHVSIWSAASGGTCWFVDDITDEAIDTGDLIVIAAGDLSLAFTVWT